MIIYYIVSRVNDPIYDIIQLILYDFCAIMLYVVIQGNQKVHVIKHINYAM